MAIFGRRQIQRMLDDLGTRITASKRRMLIGQLNSSLPVHCLGAEYELSLNWCVMQLAELEVDRKLDHFTPDTYSPDFLQSGPLLADIFVVEDESLSGNDAMKASSQAIAEEAERIRPGSGQHLRFHFGERNFYVAEGGKSVHKRKRMAMRKLQLNASFKEALSTWLHGIPLQKALRWNDERIDVIIHWVDQPTQDVPFFSSMPSLAYDLEKNPLYKALEKKALKLQTAPQGTTQAVFVGDAGCSLLRNVQIMGALGAPFTGGQIIAHFLQRYPSVGFVAVLSPQEAPRDRLIWDLRIFVGESGISDPDLARLTRLRSIMLPPHREGYRAHAAHQRKLDASGSRWSHVPSQLTIGRKRMEIKVSSRALQALLAGRLPLAQFQEAIFREKNLFEQALLAGMTISSVSYETLENEDDDLVVLSFGEDPALGAFR